MSRSTIQVISVVVSWAPLELDAVVRGGGVGAANEGTVSFRPAPSSGSRWPADGRSA
jgi:hypothetical protein